VKVFFFLFLFLLCCTGSNSSHHSATVDGESNPKEDPLQTEVFANKEIEKKKPFKTIQKCATCHAQVRTLGEGRTFDVSGIYPQMDPKKFGEGKKIPVLIESLELNALKKMERGKDVQEKVCIDCHLPHQALVKDRIEIEDRKKNLGLWVTLELIDNIMDVEIKFKSYNSAHRVPAGLASRAYVIVVNVFQKEPLALWHGPKIAKALRTKERLAGLTMARFFVDGNGKLTNHLNLAHSLIDDTRLEHQRFLGEHFLYKIDPDKEVEAVARLYYLPAFPTWSGAFEVMVERAELEPQ